MTDLTTRQAVAYLHKRGVKMTERRLRKFAFYSWGCSRHGGKWRFPQYVLDAHIEGYPKLGLWARIRGWF